MKISVKMSLRRLSELPDKGRYAQYADEGKLITGETYTSMLKANPYLKGRDMAVQYLGLADGKIVGVVSPFVLKVIADGMEYEACACTGQGVDPKYRKSGFAIELNEAMLAYADDGVTVNFNVSPVARRLAAMMGAALMPAKRFVLVKKSENILLKKLPGWRGHLICAVANVVFGAQRFVVRNYVRLCTRAWCLREVTVGDEAMLADYSAMMARDPHRFREDGSVAWVNWALQHDFGTLEAAQKKLYQVTIGGRRVGYVMSRLSGKRARILDWQVDKDDEKFLPLMLLRVILLLEDQSQVMLMAVSEKDSALVKGLRRFLLLTLPDQVACIGAAETSPLRQHKGWSDAVNWRVRPSMGDSVFY